MHVNHTFSVASRPGVGPGRLRTNDKHSRPKKEPGASTSSHGVYVKLHEQNAEKNQQRMKLQMFLKRFL